MTPTGNGPTSRTSPDVVDTSRTDEVSPNVITRNSRLSVEQEMTEYRVGCYVDTGCHDPRVWLGTPS